MLHFSVPSSAVSSVSFLERASSSISLSGMYAPLVGCILLTIMSSLLVASSAVSSVSFLEKASSSISFLGVYALFLGFFPCTQMSAILSPLLGRF